MKFEIKNIQRGNNYFPTKLELLEKCPNNIFVLGNEKILNEFSLAIVGSRRCSEFGRVFSESLSNKLSEKEIVIVSGLAKGIDAAAHWGCVKKQNKTIAVLGSGFDNIYPKENIKLLQEIIECGGAIISEYSSNMPPFKKNFIERNRIIAALSDGIILIEAKEKSGSLTTINFAKKMNKKIFVVPGGINDELYAGSNLILSEGAFCIRNSDDVLRKYEKYSSDLKMKNIEYDTKVIDVPKELKNVYDRVKMKTTSFDEICKELDESTPNILSKLTLLEIQGYIRKVNCENYIKNK